MAKISLKHVEKVYPNGYTAVKDFNLEIEDKEFVVFIGPSGCGKSTILRMLSGAEEISSGVIEMDGCPINEIKARDRDIMMLFNNYTLYSHMTVYDNLAYGLKFKNISKGEIDRRVKRAAEVLDLEPLLKCKPTALSKGQKQRVTMGRAVVRNPKVFLVDELPANLDEKSKSQMRVAISKMHERLGATFFYVTDSQEEAMSLGTKVVTMKEGQILQVDIPEK